MLQNTQTLSNQEKHCLYCGKILDPLKGRSDRKYCSHSCRYNMNNRIKQMHDPEVMRINKILSQNLWILQQLSSKKTLPLFHRDELLRMGFSFDYYTMTKADYFFCYYYGYTKARKENHILIVKGFDNIVKKN